MTIKPYAINLTPDMSDVDFTGHMKPSSALRAMQEAAGTQCDELGLGYITLYGMGLAWVLCRLRLQMDEYPFYSRPLTVTTWPTKPRHCFFPRQFTFTQDGRELGRATSIYALMDLGTRSFAPASRLPMEAPMAIEPAVLPFPPNIEAPAAIARSFAYKPVYEDIDMNGHVNNARYADWFLNSFGCAEHRTRELSELALRYDREVLSEEELTLELYTSGDESIMLGHAGGESRFALKGVWRDRG